MSTNEGTAEEEALALGELDGVPRFRTSLGEQRGRVAPPRQAPGAPVRANSGRAPGSTDHVPARGPEEAGSPQGTPVDHPPHYNSHPSGVECIEVVEHFSFNLGNAIKYVWRNGLKPTADSLEDLRKARWYIDREIARLAR